jgi:exodeoxyribonuclease-3
MRLRIASWNVNSIRLRIDHLTRFTKEQGPDVLCLQEIKCQEAEFRSRLSRTQATPI